MIEAYLNLQMALDEEYYRVVIEPYYSDTKLSFLLAYRCLTGVISDFEIAKWGSSESIIHDDLFFFRNDSHIWHIIQHFDTILQYLRSPRRSRQFSMKLAGGRLYSNALLFCLHSVHEEKFHRVCFLENRSENLREYLRSYDQNDNEILSQWALNGSGNNHEDNWRGATDTTLNLSNYLESLQTLYEDDQSDQSILHNLLESSNIDILEWEDEWEYSTDIGRQLLHDALYFFPRAGRSDKLLHFCKAKYLPKNVFSLEEEEMVFRAMDAYVDRWKDGGSGSPENDEWAYPLPLVERRESIFTDEEKEAILKLRAQSSK